MSSANPRTPSSWEIRFMVTAFALYAKSLIPRQVGAMPIPYGVFASANGRFLNLHQSGSPDPLPSRRQTCRHQRLFLLAGDEVEEAWGLVCSGLRLIRGGCRAVRPAVAA